MKGFSRRDLLKTSLLAPAAAVAQRFKPLEAALQVAGQEAGPLPTSAPVTNAAAQAGAGREKLLLDFGWRFHFGNASDPAKDFSFSGNFQKSGNFLPADGSAFDDSDWDPVDLPHDWAVELPFVNNPSLMNKGYYPLGRNYPDTSVGWYRRVFDLSTADKGKRITLEFDGSYRESMVVFNGFYIGRHSGGYDPFSFDVTDFANVDGHNVLLVRVDATSSDGWFYEGAGIYRHVWLVKTNPVHVKKWGTLVVSETKSNSTMLSIRTELVNDTPAAKDARVVSTVLDPAGKAVGKAITAPVSIAATGETTLNQQVTVSQPQLWSLEERNLYTLVTEVHSSGEVVDHYDTRFGIRSIKFDAQKGLLLNGKSVKVRGTCCHQDHAGIGAALPDAVQYFRISKLKEMGSNGLRTSHNPPATELLNACDELGMLVLDETRMMSSNPEGLGQFENVVRRDRNHPSVMMWSMGNEESTANSDRGVGILSQMKAVAYKHDGSRPVTIAPTGAIGTGGLKECDVVGYNYADRQVVDFHAKNPDRPVLATETVSAVCTRGVYITDYEKGFVGSYDPYTTTGRASAEGWWRFLDSQEWLAGGFIWTGFDYRGEPSPNRWPNISSQYGVIDICGFPKDTFFYYQSWWTQQPVLHLFPHWNWPGYEGKVIAAWVHTNMDKVELFQDGKSLGTKDVQKNQHLAWNVTYQPGVLEARGYKDGKLALTERRETTGGATTLTLTANRNQIAADGEDVAMVAVEVHDAKGRLVPVADQNVTFKVTGSGKLIGTGNGDPSDQAPDKGMDRKAFNGLCMALVQATKNAGRMNIQASSPGLATASLTIDIKAVALRPQVPVWESKIPQGGEVSGLWRPDVYRSGSAAAYGGGGNQIYILEQNGDKLTGSIEGRGGGFFGDNGTPITDGKVDGDKVSFRAGSFTLAGTYAGDVLELTRRLDNATGSRSGFNANPPKSDPTAPVIGPPPDGTDPSRSPYNSLRANGGANNQTTVLRRVKR